MIWSNQASSGRLNGRRSRSNGHLSGTKTKKRAHWLWRDCAGAFGCVGELKNVDVAAVCDLSEARAESTAERFGVARWYTNFELMLSDIKPDLVHITTPPATHFSIAKYCLERGLNVLCEKPIARDYDDFLSLKDLALKNNCMLMENQNLRYHSSIRKLLALLRSGAVGDLLHVEIFFALNLVGEGSPYTDQNAAPFWPGAARWRHRRLSSPHRVSRLYAGWPANGTADDMGKAHGIAAAVR